MKYIGVFSFFTGGELYLLLAYNTFVEFDKMQIPLKGIVWVIPASFKISLATIGVCVFVRWLRSAHFYFIGGFMKKTLLRIFATLYVCSTLAFGFAACQEEHTHSYTESVTPPTCTKQGYTTYTCGCGDNYKDNYIDATGHTYTESVTPPTCTKQGYTTYTCGCGNNYKDNYIDATGHTYIDVNNICESCNQIIGTQGMVYLAVEGGYELIGKGGITENNIIVPEYYNQQPVVSVGEKAFYGDSSIQSIQLPDSITIIKSSAFYECTKLKNVILGKGLLTISSYAFHNSGITEIDIPDSVLKIGRESFSHCSSLKKVIIGESVEVVEDSAFSWSDNISYIKIGKSLKSTGYLAFNIHGGVDEVVYTGTIESWCNIDFYYNKYGSAGNPLYYGGSLFINGELISDLVIPNTVPIVHDGAFNGCTSLKSVIIEEGVQDIGEGAFSDCTNLKSVTIGADVTRICPNAFEGCTKLLQVEFLTSSWYVNGNKVDVSNTGVAATLLKQTYVDDYWLTSTPIGI